MWRESTDGDSPDLIVLMDKGRRWIMGTVGPSAGDMHFEEYMVRTGDDGSTKERRENDWYYVRGGPGGRFVAFSRSGNLVIYDTVSRSERQVTNTADAAVQYGVVDISMEEELGRSTGIFWGPVSLSSRTQRLLCAHVDETRVLEIGLPDLPLDNKINPAADLINSPEELFKDDAYNWTNGCLADSEKRRPLCDFQKYPRPGTPNATTDWVVVELDHGPDGVIEHRVLSLHEKFGLQRLFPWCEYTVRAGWLPLADGGVWLQLLDRAQQHTAIVRIPLQCFGECPENACVDVLYEETALESAWINLSHCHYFLKDSSRDEVRLILASERTSGFNHLYLVTARLDAQGTETLRYARQTIEPLTSGPWSVTDDARLFVDEAHQAVYFSARRPNPLTQNLFVVGYTRRSKPQQLTMPGYSYSHFAFDPTGSFFYCQSSNLSTPIRHCVYQITQPDPWVLPGAHCLCVLEISTWLAPATHSGISRAGSRRSQKDCIVHRLSSCSTSSLSSYSPSISSIASDEYFVEKILSKLRSSGQQIQHSTLASDLAKLKRLTPAYVSQRVTKAVKSALPFCSTPPILPLNHLLQSTLFFPLSRPVSELSGAKDPGLGRGIGRALLKVPGSLAPGIFAPTAAPAAVLAPSSVPAVSVPALVSPVVPAASVEPWSLTTATRSFVAQETLVGTPSPQLPCSASGDPLPRLFNFAVPRPSGGYDLLFGHVYLPPDHQPDSPPSAAVVNAYGGPQCQLVANAFPYPRHRRLAMLTRMAASMAVVCVDGRGTPYRGRDFESVIRGKLGQTEVDDIVWALEYLDHYGMAALAPTRTQPPAWCSDTVSAMHTPNVLRPPIFPPPPSTLSLLSSGGAYLEADWDPVPSACQPFIDRSRVSIHGWSYGGYITLRAMCLYPQWFCLGIAGAPVVRWDWYTAAYAERYLGLLPSSQTLYDDAMVKIGVLPSDRLVLVHGWSDDNVHVAHTALLVRERGVQVSLYANERHGLRMSSSNEHFETLLAFCLFSNNLA
ncbi:hypothetical protein GGF37_003276 [Kickxella alabastrina]|nr:hypothetical protein GGF37_003276 [Kickxella alabastrina]